ncbi:hypothetical protein ACEPAG_1892 [Sanghuangporus baumii]
MQASSHDNFDELCKLYDKLNLTGRVIRVGRHPASVGGFADVWEARLFPRKLRRRGVEDEGERVALKVIREFCSNTSEMRLRKRLIREIRAWSSLHHRNVLPLYGFTYGFSPGPGSQLASLVSPWMPNSTARKYLERRSIPERIRVLTGVADGLCYLHRHDVVHGDLKGDNIMIDMNYEPKIADFGLSKLIDEVSSTVTMTHTGNQFGSVRWSAPELILQPGATLESDVWAFGMTILELFTNAAPFQHLKQDPQVIIELHKGKVPSRPGLSSGLDDLLWDICCDCWRLDCRLRPSSRVIAKKLWDLDLKCKLAQRNKRRTPPSPEHRLVDKKEDKREEGRDDQEGRVRKSPKLSALADLQTDLLPSPGATIPIHGGVTRRLIAPRSVGRSTSSSQNRTIPIMSSSSSSSSRSRSRRSSRSDLPSDFDPRRFLMSDHSISDSDIFSTLHHHHHAPAIFRRAQTEPTGLDLILDDRDLMSGMSIRSDSSRVFSTSNQNAMMLHSSFGTPAPAPAPAYARHDAYAYAYGHATPSNGYALPQNNRGYVNPNLVMGNGMDMMDVHAGLPAPDGYSTSSPTFGTPMHGFTTPSHAYSAPPSGFSTPPSGFSTPPVGFSTPPSSATYPQLYPQSDMQQQYRSLLMGANNGIEQHPQAQFLTGFDSDTTYTHAAFMSAFPLPFQTQDGSLFYPGAFDTHMDTQATAPPRGYGAPFLLPPPPLFEGDSFSSGYSASPSWSESGLPSPHQLGQLFSENFQYEQPHTTPPLRTSPSFLNESLYSSPPPLLHDLPQSHFNDTSLPRQPPLSGTVDFESMQRGMITPALSDISDAPSSSTLSTPPSLFSSTPLSGGFGDAFAFESEDEGGELDGSLALIGGLGLDVSDDFNIAGSAYDHHIRDIGRSGNNWGSDVESTGEPGPLRAREGGQGSGHDRGRGLLPSGERDENDYAEQTPHGSPRQLDFALPLTRDTEQLLESGSSAAGEEGGLVQMPPTPRLSPLPPSFF